MTQLNPTPEQQLSLAVVILVAIGVGVVLYIGYTIVDNIRSPYCPKCDYSHQKGEHND